MNYKKLENAIGNPNEWLYMSMDNNGGECACGKKNIVYRYHIIHKTNRSTAIVGSECINYFEANSNLFHLLKKEDKKNKSSYKWKKEIEKNCKKYLENIDSEIEKIKNLKIKNNWTMPDEVLLCSQLIGKESANKFLKGEFVPKEKLKYISEFVGRIK